MTYSNRRFVDLSPRRSGRRRDDVRPARRLLRGHADAYSHADSRYPGRGGRGNAGELVGRACTAPTKSQPRSQRSHGACVLFTFMCVCVFPEPPMALARSVTTVVVILATLLLVVGFGNFDFATFFERETTK